MRIFKDMDENQFWMTLWATGGTLVMTVITLIAYLSLAEDQQMSRLVELGHDPVELACLFKSGSESVKAPCLLIGQAKAKVILENGNVAE